MNTKINLDDAEGITILKDKDYYQTTNGGVTLSGGECLTNADFCLELLSFS